jgi:hypothetical protein
MIHNPEAAYAASGYFFLQKADLYAIILAIRQPSCFIILIDSDVIR